VPIRGWLSVTILAELQQQVRAVCSQVDREIGEARAVGKAGMAAQDREAELKARIEQHERVAQALTRVGEERQQHAQEQVEGLVTQGLQAIFGAGLSFHLIQSVKAGQATVDFVIRSEYEGQVVETPVMDARGGGMAAVTGFLLQLVILLCTPDARRILWLDESFAHVSEEYREPLGQVLREACDKAGVQIVMITHDEIYSEIADQRYRLSLDAEGCTEVTQLGAI